MADKTKTPVFVLTAALVGSMGLNAAQMDMVGEAKAGITEEKQVCSTYIEVTPAQLAGATFSAAAGIGLTELNAAYGATWDLGDVSQVHAVIGAAYELGAAVRACVKGEFTTTPGGPVE